MSDTVPKLPGEPWRPSNGTDGDIFHEDWCQRCAKDKHMSEGIPFDQVAESDLCSILATSFLPDEPLPEWRRLPDGRTICTAFIENCIEVKVRCTSTRDMFGGEEVGD